jgi:hypothetical protein
MFESQIGVIFVLECLICMLKDILELYLYLNDKFLCLNDKFQEIRMNLWYI